MKRSLLALLFIAVTLTSYSQSNCGNLDFEDQDFTGWTLYTASTAATSTDAPVNITPYTGANITGTNDPTAFHANVTPNYANYFGLFFPSNYTGGTFARVNHMGNGNGVGILDRTFTVTSNQPFVNFSYMFVAMTGHTYLDQPYFRIMAYDQNNQVIPSSTLEIVAVGSGTATPGFIPYPNLPSHIYKPWTPVSFDFSQYIGQPVTIRFIAADCTQGGHGGYAFVDFDCGGSTAGVPNVWPGDANYDLTVDFLDLFYVGAASGYSGTPRTNHGASWAAAQSVNWNAYSLYLVNAKHADCDGNGTVDNADVLPIALNYGNTHPFKKSVANTIQLTTAASVPINIIADKDTVSTGETLTLDFVIGDNLVAIDSICAIGLTMEYPDQLFDTAATVFETFSSVIGHPSTNLISVSHGRAGSIDLAVCRNDRNNVYNISDGTAFKLHLKTRSDIYIPATMNFSISNIVAMDRSGRKLNFNASPAHVQLVIPENPAALKEILAANVNIAPNPVVNKLLFTKPSGIAGTCYIYSVEGKELMNSPISINGSEQINTADLREGFYFLRLDFNDGSTISKKFFKLSAR